MNEVLTDHQVECLARAEQLLVEYSNYSASDKLVMLINVTMPRLLRLLVEMNTPSVKPSRLKGHET